MTRGFPALLRRRRKAAPVWAHDVSEKGLEFIARFEGFRAAPYQDAVGVWTIGYGHTHGVNMSTKPVTQKRALVLLRQDAAVAVGGVKALGVPLVQHEFDALVSFAFNCGTGSLNGGIASNLRAGKKKAAMGVLCEYVHGGGAVLPGLVRRRQAEALMFLKGVYQ